MKKAEITLPTRYIQSKLSFFKWIDVRIGPWRSLSTKELMLSNFVLEKTLESPLDNKVIKPVNPKGNQLQIFIGRIDVEDPTFWTPDVKSLLILMLGKIEGRRRRGWKRMAWCDGITNLKDTSLRKLLEIVKDREVWSPAAHGVAGSQTWLSNWTTKNMTQVNLSMEQKQTHGHTDIEKQLVVAKRGWEKDALGVWG